MCKSQVTWFFTPNTCTCGGWNSNSGPLVSHILMRTSPCWIHPRFSLLRVTSHHQLGLQVRDLILFTISPCAPTPFVDIVARTSSSPAYDYFLNKYDYSVPRSITFWSSIDYFNNSYYHFRLLQQLVRLLPTTSTTRTTTSDYFNNSYDYFRLLQQLVGLLLVWPWQGAASPILDQVGLVSCRALSPGWERPHLVALNPRTFPPSV
jgi:hypothetical protein